MERWGGGGGASFESNIWELKWKEVERQPHAWASKLKSQSYCFGFGLTFLSTQPRKYRKTTDVRFSSSKSSHTLFVPTKLTFQTQVEVVVVLMCESKNYIKTSWLNKLKPGFRDKTEKVTISDYCWIFVVLSSTLQHTAHISGIFKYS